MTTNHVLKSKVLFKAYKQMPSMHVNQRVALCHVNGALH